MAGVSDANVPRPLISMTLIVRNAATTLERCLSSLVGHVDEIVVVDTGSTDDTRAIATRFTDRVFDFTWIDDFARARQFALDHATGVWVGWQDADEVLLGGEELRPAVAALGADTSQVFWRTLLGRDAFGQPKLTYWRERLVRNDGHHVWRGRVHETLVAVDPDAHPSRGVQFPGIRTLHEDAVGGAGSDRNLRILRAALDESDAAGEPADTRTLFYLAREYADHGERVKALEMYDRYRSVAVWADERYMAESEVARIHAAGGDYQAAEAAWCRAMVIKPRWPMAYFGLASIAYFQQRWEEAVHWVDVGRSLPAPQTRLFVSQRALSHDWLIHYTVSLSHLGRVPEALWWTQFALGNDPDDTWHRANLVTFREHLGDSNRPLTPPGSAST